MLSNNKNSKSNNFKKDVKLVLLGECNVGKSSLVERLLYNEYAKDTDPTIGAAYAIITLNGYKIDIWDTAGQERFNSLVSTYYRNAGIIVIVYDLKNIKSLDKLFYYLDKITNELIHDYHCILIGNKADLVDNVDILEDNLKKRLDDLNYNKKNINILSVSVKNSYNIDRLKEIILDCCSKLYPEEVTVSIGENNKENIIKIDTKADIKDKIRSCCN